MFSKALVDEAAALVARYRDAGLKIATAESCTGGLVAAAITEAPGASAVLERGFVTYSDAAKREMLGVEPGIIDDYGAVSAQTALAMAIGALKASKADVAVAVTGVAGPDGGSLAKPVGLVHFACVERNGRVRALERRYGPLGRDEVRLNSVAEAFEMLAAAAR